MQGEFKDKKDGNEICKQNTYMHTCQIRTMEKATRKSIEQKKNILIVNVGVLWVIKYDIMLVLNMNKC